MARYSQIRAFHFVALHQGFSRAAAQLGQSQPTLSDQVRQLEQAHDVLLFHREGRQIRLTPAGESLFQLTKRLFDVEEEIDEQLHRSRAALEGTLRIVADTPVHLLPILTAFRRRHPQVFVQIGAGNTGQVVAALRNYDAEIGVLGSLPDPAGFDTVGLGAAPIRAIALPGVLPEGPLPVSALAAVPLVLREKGSRTRQRLEDCAARAGVTLRPVMEVEGREAMREIVASGAGVGVISAAELGHDPRLVSTALHGDGLEMPETLVCLSMRRDVPVIRAFMREALR